MTKKEKEQAKAEALNWLRKCLKPGDRVYTSLDHVSSSGMSRRIGVYHVHNGEIHKISRLVADAIGSSYNSDKGSLVVGGTGMDMGYHVVYRLASVLWRDEFMCIGEGKDGVGRCPSNDHFNGDKEGYTVGHKHSDGGYSLRHSWL